MSNCTSPHAHKIKTCNKCFSTNLVQITQPEERTNQYGRLSCGDCGRWLSWLPNPLITQKQEERNQAITKILANYRSRLTTAEINFLQSVSKCRTLSPKQESWLNQIGMRWLGVWLCPIDMSEVEMY